MSITRQKHLVHNFLMWVVVPVQSLLIKSVHRYFGFFASIKENVKEKVFGQKVLCSSSFGMAVDNLKRKQCH